MAEEEFLGRWKSGRPWKSAKKRFSSTKQSRGSGAKSWQERQAERQAQLVERARLAELYQAKQAKLELARKQRQEARRRREANAKRSQVVQTISNSRKLRRLSKKQLKSMKIFPATA